jgi:hypothetical protein
MDQQKPEGKSLGGNRMYKYLFLGSLFLFLAVAFYIFIMPIIVLSSLTFSLIFSKSGLILLVFGFFCWAAYKAVTKKDPERFP